MVSIIIPIYNVEKYLDKCIQSVLNQTYNDFELILVNDGSTDSSFIICEKYLKIDKRIKLINKENGGLSDARNKGIESSKGDFLFFLDSDDSITENTLEELIKEQKKTKKDIVAYGFRYIYENGNTIEGIKKDNKIFSKDEALNLLFFDNNVLIDKYINVMTCSKLYKKELFSDILFPKCRLHEDVATTYLLIDKSNGCAFANSCFYNYLQRENSIMSNFLKNKDNLKNYKDMLKTYNEQIIYFKKKNKNKIVKQILKIKTNKLLSGYSREKNKNTLEFLKKEIKYFKKQKELNIINKFMLSFSYFMPNIFRLLVKILK